LIANGIENDLENLFQFHELLSHIKEIIICIGNWKYLPNSLTDSKCSLNEVKFKSYGVAVIHKILDVINFKSESLN